MCLSFLAACTRLSASTDLVQPTAVEHRCSDASPCCLCVVLANGQVHARGGPRSSCNRSFFGNGISTMLNTLNRLWTMWTAKASETKTRVPKHFLGICQKCKQIQSCISHEWKSSIFPDWKVYTYRLLQKLISMSWPGPADKFSSTISHPWSQTTCHGVVGTS